MLQGVEPRGGAVCLSHLCDQTPRPWQLIKCLCGGPQSQRVTVHGHHSREHGSGQAGMMLEQKLRAHILGHNHNAGRASENGVGF